MSARLKVMTVFGTRPEAIKMAPVVQALYKRPEDFETIVCVTAQHRQMLDQVLQLFEIHPQYDLNLMQPNQDLFQITTSVLNGMKPILEREKPDIVLVHGDTTTTMATAMACFYLRIPVGHVEAGLRTFDMSYPFPEEMNRVVTDAVAAMYFAPTERSRQNLIKAGARESAIVLTGNTVIDALFYTLQKFSDQKFSGHESSEKTASQNASTNGHTGNGLPKGLDPMKRLVLVTTHRRENFGEPLREICLALKTLVTELADIEIVLPVHPNPNVSQTVHGILGGIPGIHLIEPLDYAPFCRLMAHATLILTDSGGIQEEAPSLSKPVLVLRDETERPEAVEIGTVKLVGPHYDKILQESRLLLNDAAAYESMARLANPYGDGKASERIISALYQLKG